MKPIMLTKENKEIVREYYINLYIIRLKEQGIYEENMYQEVASCIDYKIQKYESLDNFKGYFSGFISNHNPIQKKYKNKPISVSKKVDLIKQGNLKYLETLIDYYKNMMILNINLMNLEEPIDNKDEVIKEALEYIEKNIREYFENNYKSSFNNYIFGKRQMFFLKHDLKIGEAERNIVIDNKTGKVYEREKLYDKYYKLACKKIKNTTNLPGEKFNLLLRKFAINNVDSYFEGEDKTSTLRNYFDSFLNRFKDTPDQIIVKYNILFDDFYDESVCFIEKLIKEYISTYIRENDINKISLIYRLTSKYNELARSYLDKCISDNRYTSFKTWISARVKDLMKDKKQKSAFDMDLAINGEDEEKKNNLKF